MDKFNEDLDENSNEFNELKKEIESQMGGVKKILDGTKKEEDGMIDLSDISYKKSEPSGETTVISSDAVQNKLADDNMGTTVVKTVDDAANKSTNNSNSDDFSTSEISIVDGHKASSMVSSGVKEDATSVETEISSSNDGNSEEGVNNIAFDGGRTEVLRTVDKEFTPGAIDGIGNNGETTGTSDTNKKKEKKKKKKIPRKVKIGIIATLSLVVLLLGVVFGSYVYRAGGDVKNAVLSMASDIVGEQDPIFILILGVSEDISTPLTDTIILCGYNPSTQKAYMLSIPRDTYVGKNPASANGYDKINARFQTSAEKTVETVELITGVKIDYFVIVRNLKIAEIFETIGSIDFDVPIDMNYDDPTQDLHIHLKKGYQTLEPDQIEQLLRFRHNNNGTSYPSSYGDNDYGRMKTQRNFIKAVIDQTISIKNVGKVKDIVAYVYANTQTNMPGTKVLDYVPYGLQFSTSDLRSEQLPGQSAIINSLWFYNHSKSKTKKLVDELMIYLELDDETLRTHYKYGESLIGVKPDQDWVSDEVIEDIYIPPSIIKNVPDEKVDPATCTHDFAIVDSREATCSSPGYIKYRCILCDTEKVEDISSSGKHTWNSGVTTKSPTCTSTGEITYTCTSCGQTNTETIPAKPHSYVNGKCSVCGATDPSSSSSSQGGSGSSGDQGGQGGTGGSGDQGGQGGTGGSGDQGGQGGTGGSGDQGGQGGSGESGDQGGQGGTGGSGDQGGQGGTGETGDQSEPGVTTEP